MKASKAGAVALVDGFKSSNSILKRAMVLDDQRSTLCVLASGIAKTLRHRLATLEEDMRSTHERNSPVTCVEMVTMLANLNAYCATIHTQNEQMVALYKMATEWPQQVDVTVPVRVKS